MPVTEKAFAPVLEQLRNAGLRPTRQRLALGKRLFDGVDRHLTAETLHSEVRAAGMHVSLATVYNTLHQFTAAGLLREVVVDGAKTYFDTNVTDHHHFYDPASGDLSDIPGDSVNILTLPDAPDGMEIESVEVVIRVKKS